MGSGLVKVVEEKVMRKSCTEEVRRNVAKGFGIKVRVEVMGSVRRCKGLKLVRRRKGTGGGGCGRGGSGGGGGSDG